MNPMKMNNDKITLMEENIKYQPRGPHHVFLAVVGLVFFALAFVFVFFPRMEYSELEKRDLATPPSIYDLFENPSKFTSDVSYWFSDSEPYRDHFMTMSMGIRNGLKYYPFGEAENTISFKAADDDNTNPTKNLFDPGNLEAQGNPLAEENAKIATAGIFVIGKEPNVRAITAFGGMPQYMTSYLSILKAYADELPGVTIYAVPIPTSGEFYIPDKAASRTKPQKPLVDYIRDNVDKKVKFVDAYKFLAAHTREDIYLRTDHHWTPLGAYYAAQALAVAAGTPFKTLDSYEKKTIHNFVGSMYGYSKDISVKNSPEDFIYYIPKGLPFETTYVSYKLDKNYNIVSESGPYKGKFFHEFKDGSSMAYSTYMGGDSHLVKISTGTPGNRKLLIIKDSFGNPVPSFLFYSFSEIHVVDFRYFTKNMKQYVKENGITDLAMVFNLYNLCSNSAMAKVKDFLHQQAGIRPVSSSSTGTSDTKNATLNEEKSETIDNEKDTPPSEEKKENLEIPSPEL